MKLIRLKLLREGARVPTYGSEQAAGADLYANIAEKIVIAPGDAAWIPTGVALELPAGYAGLIYARSSMGAKRGLAPANKVGVTNNCAILSFGSTDCSCLL